MWSKEHIHGEVVFDQRQASGSWRAAGGAIAAPKEKIFRWFSCSTTGCAPARRCRLRERRAEEEEAAA